MPTTASTAKRAKTSADSATLASGGKIARAKISALGLTSVVTRTAAALVEPRDAPLAPADRHSSHAERASSKAHKARSARPSAGVAAT